MCIPQRKEVRMRVTGIGLSIVIGLLSVGFGGGGGLKDVHHAEPRLVLAHLELRSIPVRILTTMSSDVKCRVQWGHQAERVVLLTFLGAHRMHVNYPHQLARMEERVRYRLYLTARRRRLGVK